MGKEVAWEGYFQFKENIHSDQYKELTLDVHCDFHEGEADPVL
jgi:hypothetical protein